MTRVVVLRGHLVNPWELRPWALLPERFEVTALVTGSNAFDTSDVPLRQLRVRALRDLLPKGRLGDLAMGVSGDRYLGVDEHVAGADVVHAAELSFWFAAEAARLKQEHSFKLVLTVWETIPSSPPTGTAGPASTVSGHCPRPTSFSRRPNEPASRCCWRGSIRRVSRSVTRASISSASPARRDPTRRRPSTSCSRRGASSGRRGTRT